MGKEADGKSRRSALRKPPLTDAPRVRVSGKTTPRTSTGSTSASSTARAPFVYRTPSDKGTRAVQSPKDSVEANLARSKENDMKVDEKRKKEEPKGRSSKEKEKQRNEKIHNSKKEKKTKKHDERKTREDEEPERKKKKGAESKEKARDQEQKKEKAKEKAKEEEAKEKAKEKAKEDEMKEKKNEDDDDASQDLAGMEDEELDAFMKELEADCEDNTNPESDSDEEDEETEEEAEEGSEEEEAEEESEMEGEDEMEVDDSSEDGKALQMVPCSDSEGSSSEAEDEEAVPSAAVQTELQAASQVAEAEPAKANSTLSTVCFPNRFRKMIEASHLFPD